MEYTLHERTSGNFIKKPIPIYMRPATPDEVGKPIGTREGVTPVKEDDWIVTGVEGEQYPIGAEILAKTYTRAKGG